MSITAVETGSATTAGVLAVLRGGKADRDAADIVMVRATVDWAVLNEVEPDDWYANYGQAIGDRGVPLAGAGAPLVSEFAAMEYAAVLGMSTDAGKAYIGRALELRYRLPRLWGRVVAGELSVWRAGRIADHTISLSEAGAAHVDRHLAPVARSCSWAQMDRLVEEAMVRFDPEAAEARRREAAERRHFDLHVDQVTYDGTVHVDGELDLADALDLEDAIRAGATQLAACGNTESLNVRRSIAAGDLARRQLALDLDTDTDTEADAAPGRSVVLYAHLGQGPVARCGNTRSPISVEQIQGWCSDATQVIVKPVIDLAERIHVEAYEAPGPAQGAERPGRRALRVPPLHPTSAEVRHRPCRRLRRRRIDQLRQHCAVVSTPPPRQNPQSVDLHRPRPRQPTGGPPPTASSSSATTPAPTHSPPNPDHPAPHPDQEAPVGVSGAPVGTG